MPEFQVRSEETGVRLLESLEDCFAAADQDKTIWKISFDMQVNDITKRVRLLRDRIGEEECWVNQAIISDADRAIIAKHLND